MIPRIVITLLLVAALIYMGKYIVNIFYDPHRCPRCNGQGWWRGTRPDERERCDRCGGTGRV